MVQEMLFSEVQIKARIGELARLISQDYAEKDLLLVVLLKGAFVFAADLIRVLQIPVQIEFMTVSSYRGGESSGELRIVQDLAIEVKGRHLLLVEDIVDTGLTLSRVIELLASRQPLSLAICSLLSKPSRRLTAVEVDYLGFTIGDLFVVGYGLDCDQQYRQLPYLTELRLAD